MCIKPVIYARLIKHTINAIKEINRSILKHYGCNNANSFQMKYFLIPQILCFTSQMSAGWLISKINTGEIMTIKQYNNTPEALCIVTGDVVPRGPAVSTQMQHRWQNDHITSLTHCIFIYIFFCITVNYDLISPYENNYRYITTWYVFFVRLISAISWNINWRDTRSSVWTVLQCHTSGTLWYSSV